MTTTTRFFTETINSKIWYHVQLADFDNKGNIVTISVTKKEWDNIIRAFQLYKGEQENNGTSIINKYF